VTLVITTFGDREEFVRATRVLELHGLSYRVVSPEPGFRLVGSPAVVVAEDVRAALGRVGGNEFLCSGWVGFRESTVPVPDAEPEVFVDGVFGSVRIVVLAPCPADSLRIRIVAQVSGDLGPALPYLNAEMGRASYNPQGQFLTFMDGPRLVSLYLHRITIAKADDLVDVWRTLEETRRRIEGTWARRETVEPCFEIRERPPALELFKRLPRTNCRACGEATCLAFAVKLWSGEASVTECAPVYEEHGASAHLRAALEDVCAALGV
jgi:ArsR family metal-binding transcriptional regulator